MDDLQDLKTVFLFRSGRVTTGFAFETLLFRISVNIS